MSDAKKLAFKEKLLAVGEDVLRQRIQLALAAIEEAQQAANGEEKSSAGDKYETSRAMSHLEKDMRSRQLQANQNELQALRSINIKKIYTQVQPGAVVQCRQHVFFIVAGLGKILVDDKLVYFLSPLAPLALQLLNKKPGEHFLFNSSSIIIEAVF